MFISDVNRSRQAAFETTMADFESVIFNDAVAVALADGPFTAGEYRGLFDRYIPVTVKHRTISLDRASIKAGKIGIAFLTDEEAQGYNIDPKLATSLLPEQEVTPELRSSDRLERLLEGLGIFRDVALARLLDPNNNSEHSGLYRRLNAKALAVVVSSTAYFPPDIFDQHWLVRALYPTIVTTIKPNLRLRSGVVVQHESAHILQAMRPAIEVPIANDDAYEKAVCVLREFEAYFSEAQTLRALGIVGRKFPLIIHDQILENDLPVRGDYREISRYHDIEAAVDERMGKTPWRGISREVFKVHYIPQLLKRRLLEVCIDGCQGAQGFIRSNTTLSSKSSNH